LHRLSSKQLSSKKNFCVTEVAKLCPKLLIVNLKWYAIYTRPRWEKKVNNLLVDKGIESYCPLNKVRRKWSDRIKTIEEPLFKSYVFVKIEEDARTNVRMTDGVINFVYWNGKPAIVKEKEIQTIKRFLDEYENVELVKIELKPEQRVRIMAGPLMDQEGKIIEIKNKVAKVAIDSLGYILIADIDKGKLMSTNHTNFS
jgi:transcription antitermination factor NusG